MNRIFLSRVLLYFFSVASVSFVLLRPLFAVLSFSLFLFAFFRECWCGFRPATVQLVVSFVFLRRTDTSSLEGVLAAF